MRFNSCFGPKVGSYVAYNRWLGDTNYSDNRWKKIAGDNPFSLLFC